MKTKHILVVNLCGKKDYFFLLAEIIVPFSPLNANNFFISNYFNEFLSCGYFLVPLFYGYSRVYASSWRNIASLANRLNHLTVLIHRNIIIKYILTTQWVPTYVHLWLGKWQISAT